MKENRGTILQFIGVANLVLCVLFALFSLPFFWKQWRVLRTWPEADAQVLRSDVVAQTASPHTQSYSNKLEVLYTVDGRPVTAELSLVESENYALTEARAAEFAVGSHHVIRYDRANPSQARIGAGWNVRFFAAPLIIVAMSVVFGAFSFLFWSTAKLFKQTAALRG